MVNSRRVKPRAVVPRYTRRPYTVAWQNAVKRELEEREGWNKARIATELRKSRAAITKLLEHPPEKKGSSLVDPICALLGVPSPEYLDSRDAEVVADLRLLRERWPAEYDRIASKIRSAIERSPSKKRD